MIKRGHINFPKNAIMSCLKSYPHHFSTKSLKLSQLIDVLTSQSSIKRNLTYSTNAWLSRKHLAIARYLPSKMKNFPQGEGLASHSKGCLQPRDSPQGEGLASHTKGCLQLRDSPQVKRLTSHLKNPHPKTRDISPTR